MRQLFYIVIGFVFGQGMMLFSQSILIAKGEANLVSITGISLGMLSLVQWVTDAGSVFLISNIINSRDVKSKFSSLVVARLLIGLFFLSILLVFFNLIIDATDLYLPIAPLFCVVFIWAFNLTGFYDYYELNKFNGPVSSINWALSSVFLLISYVLQWPMDFVYWAFILGLMLTVFFQWLYLFKLKVLGFNLFTYILVLPSHISSVVKLLMSYAIAYVLNQAYGRFIPVIIYQFLDVTLSGYYIFARNISNVVTQIIYFSRRVEYKKLVSLSDVSLSSLFRVQYYSLFFAVMYFFSSLLMYFISDYFFMMKVYKISINIVVFLSFNNLIWVLASGFGQRFLSINKGHYYTITTAITTAISIITFYNIVDYYGLYALYGCEFIMYIIQVVVYAVLLIRNGANT
jgi:hypothetical protein